MSQGGPGAAVPPGRAGSLVRAWRRAARLTQEELAQRAGLGVRTVRDLELGRVRRPHPGSVQLLATALRLTEPDRALLEAAVRAESWPAADRSGRPDGSGPDSSGPSGRSGPPDSSRPPGSSRPPDRPGYPVPAQLPADVPAFTGRTGELSELDCLSPAAGAASAVLVSGTAGVGKTALAVHWAHRVRGTFPDGQLYVNLRGYDADQPVRAGDALAGFLTALGVPGQDIPLDVDARAARYRTELADRQVLIVLDNAASVAQVRPLLPGTPTAFVVVTSRDALAGLVAVDGARRLDLDLLPPADAGALLRTLIGARADREPEAVDTLAEQCARLPLALRVAAELAGSRPASSLAALVDELADRQHRLDLLAAGDDPHAAVRAVLSWSYQHLPADAARAFRLLGLHPGTDFDAYAAAALTDTSLPDARRLLDVLARAHLLQPAGDGRYGMHDLLRAYACELAGTEDGDDCCRAGLTRLFDFYASTVTTAADVLYVVEQNDRARWDRVAAATPRLADPDAALAWLDAERSNLVAVVARTAAGGWPDHCLRLGMLLFRYLDGGHYTEALAIHGHGYHAARQAGDTVGQAHALTSLGVVAIRLGRYDLAGTHHQQALASFREAGDRYGEVRALISLGGVYWEQGRYALAAAQYTPALALCRSISDRHFEAHILNNLGIVGWRLGQHSQAADHLRQALALFRQLGDRSAEAHTLDNLGSVHLDLGRRRQAADHFQRALDLHRELGDRKGEADSHAGLAAAHQVGEDLERARLHWQRALDLYTDLGVPEAADVRARLAALDGAAVGGRT